MLVDLSRSKEEMWAGLKRKSCRADIKKAAKQDPEIILNDQTDAAFRLVNDHIARKRYRSALRQGEWERVLSHGDLFSIRWQERLICTHAVLVDPTGRVRLIMAAEVKPLDEAVRGMVGPMNRLLHWHELNYYKDRGCRYYDFGGLILDESSPAYNVSRFKLSFGGEPIVENVMQLWRGPAARRVLRELAGRDGARGALKAFVQAGARLQSVRET
jgi:hypothetical protein